MRAVFKKEWLGSFRSLIGWIFLAAALFLLGWYYRYYGLTQGMPYLSYIINGALFLFLFAFPVLTMRSFAEEKRQRTDQLLFTVPVPVWKIVLGKYLGAVCVFLLIVPVLMLYLLLLRVFGQVPVAENLLALFSFVCFGMACIAVGVFLSAITENQIVAAVLTFFVLMLGAMAPGITSMISEEGNALTRLIGLLDLTAPFDYSLYGILYLPSYLYYLSVVLLMLGLSVFHLNRRHLKMALRGIGRVFAGYLGIAAYVAVILACNLILALVPDGEKTIDLTYNKIRSVTEEGRTVLDALTEDVAIYVLADEAEKDETIDAMLRWMEEYSPHVSVRYMPKSLNPYFYLSYTDVEPEDNSIIVASSHKSRVIRYYDCYQVTLDYAYNIASGEYEVSDYKVTGYDGEGRVLSAIAYVVSDHVPLIACVTGHEELDLPEELRARIENAVYDVETIQLINHEEVPEDVDILFVLGPFTDYSAEEVGKLRSYMARGKAAVFVCAFTDAVEPVNYFAFLEDYGVEVLPGVVVESDASYYNMQPYYLLPDIKEHDITRTVYTPLRTKYVYMPFAKGLRLKERVGVQAQVLLSSTEGARVEAAQEDGPFALAVYVERYGADGTARALVLSSDYFFYNEIDQAVSGSNYEFFLRALAALGDQGDLVDIPVKSYEYAPLLVGSAARGVYSVLFIGILPISILAAGAIVWYTRRAS